MDNNQYSEQDQITEKRKEVTSCARLTTTLNHCPEPAATLTCDQWTDNLPPTKHVQFFTATNWAATPLGPLSSWSVSLRLHIFTLFADSKASVLVWGTEKVKIYNEHFMSLTGKDHTLLKGMLFPIGFPGLWEKVEAGFAKAQSSGMASRIQEMEMYVHRSGFEEETYFSGNIIPMRGNSGKVEGFYVQAREITSTTISERRRAMLNHMEVTSSNGLNIGVIPIFEENPRDIPMALLYTTDEEDSPGRVKCSLQGLIGMPQDHPLAVKSLDLDSDIGLAPLLRKARTKIITVDVDEMFDGVKWQGFGEPCKKISVLPIIAPSGLFGFAVIGANPRRPIDAQHDQFMLDISSKLSAIGASVLTSEETRKREERLQRELAESTKRIRYMAQHASIGMQYLSLDGTIVWANDEYYRLTSHPREESNHYPLSFLDTYVPEDRARALNVWTRLLQGEYKISSEFHLKHEYIPPSGNPEPSCVLTQSFRVTENNKLSSIITFTTDISTFKWAQASEARKAAEASEAKRKQEEFIDLLSHELRNPLSAIFQLADTIIHSFPDGDSVVPKDELVEALKSNIENANTIIMCAKHQKRIVDDVLTLSKLKYTMLSISPRPAQLSVLTQQTVKIFEQELISSKIRFKTVADASLKTHDIEWVMCDGSRIQQILINLLTNAIKFTKIESKREIEIHYGACLADPRSHFPDMFWAPQQQTEAADLTLDAEWGCGQPLYLAIMVHDSGVGMSAEEIQKLFMRFEQANERTSIRYGGSGLGLFVSQKLAETQGGEIGVRSTPGTGSTFGFYVKSRRSGITIGANDHRAIKYCQPTPPGSPMVPSILEKSMLQSLDQRQVDPNRMYVLLVEDNIVNQHVVQRQLVKAGHVVYLANHGVEALEQLRETNLWHNNTDGKQLDIILMDWEMPIMDGLTCSREIRRYESEGKVLKHVEIMATTANARPEQITTALESGIDSVVVKPFRVTSLLKRMYQRLDLSVPLSTPYKNASSP